MHRFTLLLTLLCANTLAGNDDGGNKLPWKLYITRGEQTRILGSYATLAECEKAENEVRGRSKKMRQQDEVVTVCRERWVEVDTGPAE